MADAVEVSVSPTSKKAILLYVIAGTVAVLAVVGSVVPEAREYVLSTSKALLSIIPSFIN